MKRFLWDWDCEEATAPAEESWGKTQLNPTHFTGWRRQPGEPAAAGLSLGHHSHVQNQGSFQGPWGTVSSQSSPVLWVPGLQRRQGEEGLLLTPGDSRMRRWVVSAGVCPRLHPGPWGLRTSEARGYPGCPGPLALSMLCQGQDTEAGRTGELWTRSVLCCPWEAQLSYPLWIPGTVPCFDKACPAQGGREGWEDNSFGMNTPLGALVPLLPPLLGLKLTVYLLLGVCAFWLQREGKILAFTWVIYKWDFYFFNKNPPIQIELMLSE